MRVLGIDPGIARAGWGVVENQKTKVKSQNFGCIQTDPKDEVQDRLKKSHGEVSRLIQEYSPDALAVEELFFNTNAKTAFVVGQARGVILLAAEQKLIPNFIYTPLQVKIAITGYGRAEKEQIGKMVKTILKLSSAPKLDDTADALAVGLTHLFSIRMKEKS